MNVRFIYISCGDYQCLDIQKSTKIDVKTGNCVESDKGRCRNGNCAWSRESRPELRATPKDLEERIQYEIKRRKRLMGKRKTH